MTGLRKNVKLIANRSRQRAVRSSAGIGSTAVFLDRRHVTGSSEPPPGKARSRARAASEEVDHDPVCSSVLSKIVEWFEPWMTCFSAFGIPS